MIKILKHESPESLWSEPWFDIGDCSASRFTSPRGNPVDDEDEILYTILPSGVSASTKSADTLTFQERSQ